jgi:acetoacetyl-CoA synthetase
VVNELGELVITTPLPSMPICFWHDPDEIKYRAAYFERFPGAWCHGDWVKFTDRGSCVITGRSDGTLNRGGVRLGTSEFYSALDDFPEIADSLVVHLEDISGGLGTLFLFVQLTDGSLDAAFGPRSLPACGTASPRAMCPTRWWPSLPFRTT